MVRRPVVVAVAALVLVVAAPPAFAEEPPPDDPAVASALPLTCGAEVTTDVTLTADLTCTGAPPIRVLADVTIDLAGHTLTTVDPPYRCDPIPRTFCAVMLEAGTLRGGTLRGAGVVGVSGTAVEQVRIEQGSVLLRTGGVEGTPTRLVDSVLMDSGVTLVGSSIEVRSNLLLRSGVSLYHEPRAMHDITVVANVILGDGAIRNGISAALYPYGPNDMSGRVAGNIVLGATQAGVSVRGNVQNLAAFEISGNLVAANRGSGIEVKGTDLYHTGPYPYIGGPVTIARNLALLNGGAGIDASWVVGAPTGAVVDGGRNTAIANRTRPQCIGVICSR